MAHRLPRLVRLAANLLVRCGARVAAHRWWPPSLTLRLVRRGFGHGGEATAAAFLAAVPATERRVRRDLRYGDGPLQSFDLVLPAGPGPHPLVIWVHGGGWSFGDKSEATPYLELLATQGYAGASLNYPLAPEHRYPEAVASLRDGVAHLIAHAEEFGLDPSRVVLAGDSVGTQLVTQLALITVDPSYAARVGLEAPLEAEHLRGLLLFCGVYDATTLTDSDRLFAVVLGSAMRALTGRRSWQHSEIADQMSVVRHVCDALPPAFLTAGEADPLTRRQTGPMARRLHEVGVSTDLLLFDDPAVPVGHQFHQHLHTPAGTLARDRALAFLADVLAR